MGAEGRPSGRAIHASAVAIGDRALVIMGPSKVGKSRLAVSLIKASTRRLPIMLVGDDRILLRYREDQLEVRPHPRIAGFLELRGLGFVAMRFREHVPVAGLVTLGPATIRDGDLENFPEQHYVHHTSETDLGRDILAWFAPLPIATCLTQRHTKIVTQGAAISKD